MKVTHTRGLLVAVALVVVLVVAFSLGAAAQDPAGLTAPGESEDVPEKVTVVDEVELLPAASGTTLATYYKRYSANTFVPYDDDMNYSYQSAGCVYRLSGTSYSEHGVQLPDGAEITYLRIYFYDMDADDEAGAILFAFDGAGNSTTIAQVESSGTPGYSSVGSGTFSYFVDNTDEALSLRLDYNGGSSSTLRICGVRLQYKYTLAKSSLPLILNETNP